MTTTYEEEDNSSASSDQQKSNDSRRKRKATEDMSDEEKQEAAVKRLKNREAAKKCREKKIQETENLKKKNEELEKENCDLVRQRDELRQRCNALEEKLRQHKMDGCMISGFSSPYRDLSHILDPTTPPSPSFAGSHSPCSSPASSVSPAPASLSGYTLDTYENDPAPMNYIDDSIRNVHGSQGNTVTNQVNSQVNNSQVTLTEMREMRGGSVAMPSTSQQTPGSIQDHHQVYPYCVREKARCPTNVQQARDEYLKRLAKMQASKTASTKSQQPNGVSAPDSASVSSPCLISSTSQISQGILPEPVLGADQTANSQLQAKVSMQNCMRHDWMPFTGLGNDFRLVNPNDVFTRSEGVDEYDQSGLGLSEVEAVAVQPKEADMTDNDGQTFGHMFLEQLEMIKPELDILTNPVEQTVLHFQNESVNNLGNDKTLTVTVTNPQMTGALEHTSVVHYKEPGELALSLGSEGTVEEPMSSQTGQAVPHTTSTADPPPSSIVIYIDDPQDLKKPISTFPANTDFGGFSEDQQLSFDSITDMKTIKLRPKALKSGCRIQAESRPQLIARQNAAMSTRSHWDGIITSSAISNSSFRPLKDSHTSNPSGTIGFQQESVSILPTYQNINAPNSVLQLTQQQPQVLQIPISPHVSRSKAPQTIQIKAKTSNQVEEQTLLMTENSHNMMDFLDLYDF